MKNVKKREEIKDIIQQEEKIEDKLRTVRGFREFVERVRLGFELLKDWYSGSYRAPWKLAAAIGFGIAYFLTPVDAIPDFLQPVIGYLDDASVLAGIFATFYSEIEKYKAWKLSKGGEK